MKALITVVVIFYNNKREAERTLYTLSSQYQREISGKEYRVLAIDNASAEPLEEEKVKSFGDNFDYLYYKTDSISPCAALNEGIKKAKTPYVMCIIDGAHMLSPGVMKYTLSALKITENPLVYTIPLHLGGEFQNYAIHSGYNQKAEDRLLKNTDWRNNGYELYHISNIGNSRYSFASKLAESNCFTVKKDTLTQVGGFDERFISSGGGMVNLHTFAKLIELPDVMPIALNGEASFHQFHGGVSTNIPNEKHPLLTYKTEYEKINGAPYAPPEYAPHLWGHFPKECQDFIPISTAESLAKIAKTLRQNGQLDEAQAIAEYLLSRQPNTDIAHALLGSILQLKNNNKRALGHFQKAISLNPLAPISINYYLNAGRLLNTEGKPKAAIRTLEKAALIHPDQPEIYTNIARFYFLQKQTKKAQEYVDEAIRCFTLKPERATAGIGLANLLFQEKAIPKARDVVQTAIKAYPDNAHLYFLAGRADIQLKEFESATLNFEKALELKHRNLYSVYKALGNVYNRQRRNNDAIYAFHKALEIKPDDKDLKIRLEKMRSKMQEEVDKHKFNSFIYMHIPKCGGMSMRRYVCDAALYSGFAASQIHAPKYNDFFPNRNLVQMSWDELGLLKDHKIRVLADHTDFNAHTNYRILSLKAPFYYSILREPITRTVSHYYYNFFQNGNEGLRMVHINDLTEKQLDRICYTIANQQVVYLAEMGVNEGYRAEQKHLDRAKDVLENQLQCFGLLEKMEESISILKQEAPEWMKFYQDFPKLNTGHKKKEAVVLEPHVKETIEKYNKFDIELYDFAVQLFEKRLKKMK